MQILTLDVTSITVKEGLDRFRQEMGEVEKLAESILKYGQMQPIGITRNNELVWGGRRLAACFCAGVQVKAIYSDEADPLLLRLWKTRYILNRAE